VNGSCPPSCPRPPLSSELPDAQVERPADRWFWNKDVGSPGYWAYSKRVDTLPSPSPVNTVGRYAPLSSLTSPPTRKSFAPAEMDGITTGNKVPNSTTSLFSSTPSSSNSSSSLFPRPVSLVPQAPLSDDHYIEVSSFKHFELPDALPGGRPCRWLVPHEALGSQVLRPFYFAASTNSDQTEIEAENGGLPVPLCLGNCGNPPCRVRLEVADDIQRALQNRGQRIDDWCCGSCVLSHLTFVNAPEVQHRVKEPKLRHGKRCTCYNTHGWTVLHDNSVSASAADLVTDLDSDEYTLVQVIQTNDMQYTPASPRVFYAKCPWCHQFPADHHQEDCPRKFDRVPKKLSHLNPCLYCKMNKPDHYSRHCHMKPLFKEYNMDRVWKYDKCFYCHHDHPDHPG